MASYIRCVDKVLVRHTKIVRRWRRIGCAHTKRWRNPISSQRHSFWDELLAPYSQNWCILTLIRPCICIFMLDSLVRMRGGGGGANKNVAKGIENRVVSSFLLLAFCVFEWWHIVPNVLGMVTPVFFFSYFLMARNVQHEWHFLCLKVSLHYSKMSKSWNLPDIFCFSYLVIQASVV